ncbi:hypothetical protein FYK55_11170 [Roseiconus nitratireducens]|uniref:Cytochrome c n=1 Tax=Roseiconus nitratireducens TaxID=2605748 RepID=A0A5M6DBG4_9BACT|nr:hypothetical protein [Roseiconus nitratireducens]KAA5543740.1 hypothetical protein FYK55_11170 [Roseiconus nitratireducens]
MNAFRWFVLLAVVSTGAMVSAQDPIDGVVIRENVVPLMHRKLDRAKDILEGLTLEQYEKIASNARSLRLLSMESDWNVVQTQEYQKQSNDFRRACDSIEKAAEAKDASRAALAYVTLTVRCIECHRYMRDNKIDLTSYRK